MPTGVERWIVSRFHFILTFCLLALVADAEAKLNEVRVPGTQGPFGYDPIGQLNQATAKEGSTNRLNEQLDYGYGYGGELATASTKDSSGNSVYGQQFAYTQDLAENITTRSTGAGYETFAHDWAGLNRATTAGQAGFYHDANGNPTYKFDYTPYPDSWDTFYTYDDRDRLVSVKSDAVYTPEWKRFWVEFEYDGLSRLKVRRTYSWYSYYGGWYLSENVGYLYDGMTPVALRKYSGGTPYQTTYFTRGNDLSGVPGGAGGVGGLVAMSQQSSGGSQTAFYHNDGNGNVTGLMDQWGGLAGEYKYDPFGRDLGTSGWMSGQNPFRFSSKEWLAGPGLNHYGYRFYNPTTQKWLNRDPIREAGGINIYGFVGNDPVNFIDPNGLETIGYLSGATWIELFRGFFLGNSQSGGVDKDFHLTNLAQRQRSGTGLTPLNDADGNPYARVGDVALDAARNVLLSVCEAGLNFTGVGALDDVARAGKAAKMAKTAEKCEAVAAKTTLQTTAHGAERIAGAAATRGGVLSEAGVAAVQQGGRAMIQADGAMVRILTNEAGRSSVVVSGERGIITTFENLSQKSLDRLAKNYGWK